MSRLGGASFSLERVEVWRGERVVLRVPSLAVADGESLAIVGPNGAGKSTMLQVLAGLLEPATGEAKIGAIRASLLEARRTVALVPQDAPMLRGSVRRNVELPLTLRGLDTRRASAAMERTGVLALADRNAAELSGGESRRVALARALATDPSALLLDEPFSGLDAPARESLLGDLKGSLREHGRTLVLVTQHRDEALRLASRIAVVWNGEVRQTGAPEEILSRPAGAEVARFLGVANVLRARAISAEKDVLTLDAGGLRLLASSTLSAGAQVYAIFAPENVEVRKPGATLATSARNVFPATVRGVEPREGRVELRLDAAGVSIVAAVTRAAVEELQVATGSSVEAVVKATTIHVVGAEPER